MRIRMSSRGLEILPESERDQKFIEKTLGLKRNGESIPLRRISVGDDGGLILKLEARREPRAIKKSSRG